ncbi:Uncharacterized protein TCM_006334 [Theobroma cacao]|uniref:Uncharacterized protein n=1 Tax=Theobroma cacao TaxID=3641 RepID=A0A061DX59_THECC|nr:Uncharacterized protein TCM_006334 [Theobroma cacao]
MLSVRFLPDEVAWRVIVATDESSTIAAPYLSTTETNRAAPNHLSVMPANLAWCTSVRGVIIVGLLINPHPHGVGSRKVSAAHCKVLAIRSTGVHEVAIANVLIGVVLCKGSYVVVPSHGANTDRCTSRVVSIEVVLRGVLGMGGEDQG